MVEDELFTPLLGYVSLLSVLQGHERAFGAATLRVDAPPRPRRRRARFACATSWPPTSPRRRPRPPWPGPLALLVGNDFEKVAIEKLDVSVDAVETLETATLVRAWVDRPLPLRPGTVAPVQVQLRTHRGETVTETLPVAIPASAPTGSYTLLVADAATMDAVEQREMRQGFVPRDMDQLLRALNRLRAGNRIYARLTRPGGGAVVGGRVPAGAPRLRALRAELLRPGHGRRRPPGRVHGVGRRARHRSRRLRLAADHRLRRALEKRHRLPMLRRARLRSRRPRRCRRAALHAAGPQFWRLEGARAFLEGDIEGLSLDSDGRLRLGASPRPLFDPEAPNAWCVARDARGVLYVGTGNDGRVLRVDGTKGSVLFDAAELEVHAVAVGPDGRVYAATSPDGAVYAIDAAGKATRFFDPAETYIWALAFDPKGALYVATGGEGRVYRVSADGKSETVLTSTETHILSLAVDARGRVYAGSAPEGLVYRIDGPGKVFVLLDSAFREIKALDVGEDGSLYAAAIDGRTTESPTRATPAPAPTGSGAVVAEVTVSESYAVVPASGGAPVTVGPAGDGRGGGSPVEGRASPHPPHGRDRHPVELARRRPPLRWSRSGADVLVGTGNKGKVYRVGDDGRWALVATLPAEQVTAFARGPRGAWRS